MESTPRGFAFIVVSLAVLTVAHGTHPSRDATMDRMADEPTRSLLLISGSTRDGSINTSVLRTATALLPPYSTAEIYAGLAQLPHFDPDLEQSRPPSSVTDLRTAIRTSDALLFCTPEYAGAMPGALKNLLEWTIGDTVMSGKPVGWINPSTAPQRASGSYESLRTVLSYTGAAIVEAACLDVPVGRSLISDTGTIDDPTVRMRIRTAVLALASSTD